MDKRIIPVILTLVVAGLFIYAGWSIELNLWLVGGLGAGIGFLLGGPIGALIGGLGGAVAASFLLKVIAVILAAWAVIVAIMITSVDEDKIPWALSLWVFSTLLVIFLLLPGPLPFWIGEILMGLGSAVSISKVQSGGSEKKLGMF